MQSTLLSRAESDLKNSICDACIRDWFDITEPPRLWLADAFPSFITLDPFRHFTKKKKKNACKLRMIVSSVITVKQELPRSFCCCLSYQHQPILRLGSHIHNFELRQTATFEIGASDRELRSALDHQESKRGVSGCAALRRQASPVVIIYEKSRAIWHHWHHKNRCLARHPMTNHDIYIRYI